MIVGHTYERKNITEWVTMKGTSPMTREKISPNVLILNRAVKSRIDQWKLSKGITVAEQKPPKVVLKPIPYSHCSESKHEASERY